MSAVVAAAAPVATATIPIRPFTMDAKFTCFPRQTLEAGLASVGARPAFTGGKMLGNPAEVWASPGGDVIAVMWPAERPGYACVPAAGEGFAAVRRRAA